MRLSNDSTFGGFYTNKFRLLLFHIPLTLKKEANKFHLILYKSLDIYTCFIT